MSVIPTIPTAIEVAIAASIHASAAAERELQRARAERSRAAEALERSAGRPGCVEAEREFLRAAFAQADSRVSERQADLDRARALQHAWAVVAPTLDITSTGAAPSADEAAATGRPARRRPSRRPAWRPVARPA
jgi:hypothetical protein